MKNYTLLHPVFQINGAKDNDERCDLCVVPYIRLQDNIRPDVAVRTLREELAKKYDVPLGRVTFHFFSDGVVMGGGSPRIIG